ncbi:zinc finger ranBP2-type protein [Fadolivirus algeromassiliense]|jgi:hypothetical protein|uniref:Zinc finger ranBP2-type protein n=1 Tax=Fadolivirus FV1/VV64 TaxID=3070911 RepID=A0A7D3UTY5_9VIRU|nr:zinc finger ranBP2-type protein [Fadolivirus algeromassiliense]QKF94690.1 zinc finger ranBP2-type protein [Fadolivirus FV1/VV64]
MSKRGDWNCPDCGYSNFASRTECLNCKCWRSKALKSQPMEKKKGDWNCSCGELNFASRTGCRKCGKNKDSNDTNAAQNVSGLSNNNKSGQINSKPGDWNCTCGTMNWGSRTVCFTCGKQKDPELTQTSNNTHDDTCVICMERNKDTVITVCGHLGYCGLCALNMNKCPICRVNYNPDTHLLKVFKV